MQGTAPKFYQLRIKLQDVSIGMVGHFAKGRYDDVSLTDFVEAPSQ